MHSTDRNGLYRSLFQGAAALGLAIAGAAQASASVSVHEAMQPCEVKVASEHRPDAQLAGLPFLRGIRGPVYHYGYGPSCGPNVPTTRTMQNNIWQSHQWKGEYPVCQPLYAPNFGHHQTRWRPFPGADCANDPTLGLQPY